MKKLYLFLAFFLLAGCDMDTYKVVLIKQEIEYQGKNFNVCPYIKSINAEEIDKYNINKNTIDQGDYHAECESVPIKELGKQEVEVKINGISNFVNFEMLDTTPPKITIDKDSFIVEKSNEYFDIKKMIKVKDAYDKKPIIGWSGEYDLNTPGQYIVKLTAQDTSKNKATKDIKIIVKEKQVEIIEKTITIPGSSPGNSIISGTTEGGTPPKNNVVPSSLPAKTWTLNESYDMHTAFQDCKKYRGSNAGKCQPILGPDGLPIAYQYLP